MKIDTEALNVLDQCTVDGNILFLPSIQLERKLYEKVNKVLECLGGKWNRSKRGHIFANNPAEMIEEAILTGEVTDAKKEFQFFETPDVIAKQMIDLAEITVDDKVCEPSAGRAAIAKHIPFKGNLIVCELNRENVEFLMSSGYIVLDGDFLTKKFSVDKFVMNPPFSKQQDIDHVLHAWELLKSGGRLVAIMSEGTFFRENKKAVDFRKLLRQVGYSIPNDDGAFKESGTMVKTRIVVMMKEVHPNENI